MLRDGKIQLQRNVIDIQYRLCSQDRQVQDPRKFHSNAVREEGLNCPDIKRPKMSGLRTACLPKLESSYAGRTMGMVRRRVSWRKHRICTLLQRLILFL